MTPLGLSAQELSKLERPSPGRPHITVRLTVLVRHLPRRPGWEPPLGQSALRAGAQQSEPPASLGVLITRTAQVEDRSCGDPGRAGGGTSSHAGALAGLDSVEALKFRRRVVVLGCRFRLWGGKGRSGGATGISSSPWVEASLVSPPRGEPSSVQGEGSLVAARNSEPDGRYGGGVGRSSGGQAGRASPSPERQSPTLPAGSKAPLPLGRGASCRGRTPFASSGGS